LRCTCNSTIGTGLGRSLFGHVVTDLPQREYQAATLWVLDTYARARRFYEMAEWRPDGKTKIEHFPGFDLHELR
jgi:hypothetical protein